MTHLPWMQIFIGDELAETSALSPSEYGCHMRLRLHQWQHGELPSDEERLRRICLADREEWPSIRDVLAPLFDWQWHHQRTAELRKASEEKREKMAENGKKGGRPRKSEEKPMESQQKAIAKPNGKANGKADGKPIETPSPSPSPSPLESETHSPSAPKSDGWALERREDEDRESMFSAFPVPPSAAEARRILSGKGIPQARMDECVRRMMAGDFSQFDLEGVLEEARSAA
ncbi:DUF1376 domain-containing protein [Neorhizobium petrolearium]|uniref:DUF1376 domain-containing protein n=1 Tax=Neorhizobium petrolearium TaxID=515361 RepID=A0ABY8M0A9_9HYPH|nr:DUF1376 domain-containing protein [Neorhizobium petrolearium]MCC2612625.1 DUF1376 domain-containing protein [Neorhizobium petrolearium]WGI67748.1 DUF1376 domain-containing protein [Neorhizobium petrolearium]